MSAALEMWGGVECTVNRVGDSFYDQLERTGHASRIDDLDRVRVLGIRTLRQPLLWERMADAGCGAIDFAWADQRLARARALGLNLIAGLVHHGSGPRGTSLLDDSFATGLARFAERVAQRYPWLHSFTPVNEPLTTARFSALYGHWYPHRRDASAFVRALLVQTRATHAAMAAIRRVIPQARLVQTEDIGTVFASPAMQYQADFENERRWLSLDLLMGRVGPHHRLWRHLLDQGAPRGELEWFVDHPCPPDLIGVNYYVTSDRYLDDRTFCYPAGTHGSNGHDTYADVEAVRVCSAGIVGHGKVLRKVWERYRVPLALTEAHLGACLEDQIRWLVDAWQGAQAARAGGADVRAVTSWALFGSYDWDSLVVEPRGHYEAGAFDVRTGRPRPTALATVVQELAQQGCSSHSALPSPGWWKCDERVLYDPAAPAMFLHAGNCRAGAVIQAIGEQA